jgi:murein DD-endopeptidase MepM/ murein hydrolase activator NlpD
MQPDSLRVDVGDHVRKGQVLGLLGNSGNTDGPHLHFHVMDSPSPLQSNGLPYVFDRFTGLGRIDDISTLQSGAAQTINGSELAGRMRARMPLADEVVNFPR